MVGRRCRDANRRIGPTGKVRVTIEKGFAESAPGSDLKFHPGLVMEFGRKRQKERLQSDNDLLFLSDLERERSSVW